jgi:hypothetical protein
MTGFEPNIPPPEPDPVWVPPEPVPRRPLWRPLGVLLSFAASILTLLGSFLTLLTSSIQVTDNERVVLTITSWGFRTTTNGVADSPTPVSLVPINGPPMVFAATALLTAAVVGLLASAAPGSVLITRAGSMIAVAAAAFVAATVWSILVQELNWIDRYSPSGLRGPQDYDVTTSIGLGFWLLLGATVAAIAGAVFACLPLRRRIRRRTEPDTPALGIPVVVVHRLPDEPADEPE